MKKALSMALTAAMMMVMCVTAFAADDVELPTQLPDVATGWLNTIIDFFAELLRMLGELAGVVFK